MNVGALCVLVVCLSIFTPQIVASVSIRILSTPFSKSPEDGKIPALYAGQPVTANVSIQTTFHWGSLSSDSKPEKNYLLRFNIEEMVREWLISGPKRGDFIAKVSCFAIAMLDLVLVSNGLRTTTRTRYPSRWYPCIMVNSSFPESPWQHFQCRVPPRWVPWLYPVLRRTKPMEPRRCLFCRVVVAAHSLLEWVLDDLRCVDVYYDI